MAISGATLALVIASTAAVAAHGPRDDARGYGRGGGMGMDAWRGAMEMPGVPGGMGYGLRGAFEDFERRETTIQTADGTTSYRVEQGVVTDTSDVGLEFSLAEGEVVSVGIDGDTSVIGLEPEVLSRRGWNRERLAPTVLEPSDIEAGAEVIVWSTSEDGGDFFASRVVIRPADDAADDVQADPDAADDAEAADETEGDAAAVADA